MIRLPVGQTADQAQASFRAVQPSMAEQTRPTGSASDAACHLDRPFRLIPSATGSSELRATCRAPVLALMTMAARTLLIACANIANLLLARTTTRRQESLS